MKEIPYVKCVTKWFCNCENITEWWSRSVHWCVSLIQSRDAVKTSCNAHLFHVNGITSMHKKYSIEKAETSSSTMIYFCDQVLVLHIVTKLFLYAWWKKTCLCQHHWKPISNAYFNTALPLLGSRDFFFSSTHFYGITSSLRTKMSHDFIRRLKWSRCDGSWM